MIVVTHHGEEESKPIAVVSTYEKVREAIIADLAKWVCPPQEPDIRFNKQGQYHIYEHGELFDHWNCYTATTFELDAI